MTDALLLGLESTCDETSGAVVAGGRRVLSNVVASQLELHARFGGVVPEIASRAHLEAVNTVIAQALDQAGVKGEDLAAVAVANQPGLIGSLLIGLVAAKTLAWVWDRPLVAVNHIHAHAYSPALDDGPIGYPAVALVASGGHTSLYLASSPIDLELLGATLDDAAGEAFDKVAAILKLGFPGGPAIDRLARTGNPNAIRFPRTLLKGQSLDFSFSGLKTAVLYHVNGVPGAVRGMGVPPMHPTGVSPVEEHGLRVERGGSPEPPQTGSSACQDAERVARLACKPWSSAGQTPATPGKGVENMSAQEIADVAASFQAAVVDVLRVKLRRAVKLTGAGGLVIGGGVAANSALRAMAADLGSRLRIPVRLPAMKYCADNAAMTAGVAYHLLAAGLTSGLDLEATPTIRR